MADKIVTAQKLKDADKDCDALDQAVSGGDSEYVKTRRGKEYPTMPNAIRQIMENGGFMPFATEAELLTYVPNISPSAAKAMDTKKVWLWKDNGWHDTGLSELDRAKDFTLNQIESYEEKHQDGMIVKILEISDENGFNVAELTNIGMNTVHQPIEFSEDIESKVDENGFIISTQSEKYKEDISGKWTTTHEKDYIISDTHGFLLFSAINSANTKSSKQNLPERSNFIAKKNAEAITLSSAVKDRIITNIAKCTFDYNIVVVYGQSLSTGTEAWPALTKTAVDENLLMFGDSTRPNTTRENGGSSWSPVGASKLNTLKATVQSTDNSSILSDSEVASLSAGSTNEGESIEYGAINFFRSLQNDALGVSVNNARKIVVLSCGVQGRTIQQLSKGSTNNHYNRIIDSVTKLKSHILSKEPNATIGHISTLFLQGEYNYYSPAQDEDKDVYLSLQNKLRLDIYNDVTRGILNQKNQAAFITYQTCSVYTNDDLHVGEAQLEASNDKLNYTWLASPNYHVTDKGGHLDSNGYRWLGMYFGRVMHNIINRSVDFKPLQPISSSLIENEILINFLIPTPPLRFDNFYSKSAATMLKDKGFRVEVNRETVVINSVSIIDTATVSIVLKEKPVGDITVYYAGKSNAGGCGNLCDSNADIATMDYEYHENSGQYVESNIPELINKPYPLRNFCVAFKIKVEEM